MRKLYVGNKKKSWKEGRKVLSKCVLVYIYLSIFLCMYPLIEVHRKQGGKEGVKAGSEEGKDAETKY